ncbi:MAG: 4'-phosphopantetheinyl transferase superfamily protein [Acidobacteriota bacterium]|nr:4'-phosphopantetheinyl transferase superfamily protein [Acidobacteriota bacterium]
MAAIVPPGVCCSEQVGELYGNLFPEEARLLSPRTVNKRREEFTAGRTCARNALAMLGSPSLPLLQGEWREPLWPQGITGSITHCNHYCAASVARVEDCRSIGIDAELNEPLESGLLSMIASDREREWISQAMDPSICWDRLLFSMKESIYKAWYPLERCWLGFEEAEIEVDVESQSFLVTLLATTSVCPAVLHGAFGWTPAHLFTVVSL